jgi:hypothetical protein
MASGLPITIGDNILPLPKVTSFTLVNYFTCASYAITCEIVDCGVSFSGNNIPTGEYYSIINDIKYNFYKHSNCINL